MEGIVAIQLLRWRWSNIRLAAQHLAISARESNSNWQRCGLHLPGSEIENRKTAKQKYLQTVNNVSLMEHDICRRIRSECRLHPI